MCKNCQNKLVGKAPYRVDHVGSFKTKRISRGKS